MPRGGGPYGDTFDEFLNGPDYRSEARARQRPSESMHERAAREHAEIVGLAEALAPDMARERNVPIEQVRQELTSGVRYPEPALTSFYHQTLGRLLGSPPQEGEPALARVSRLRGMGVAQDIEGGRRAESLKGLGTLLNLRGAVKDPSALEPAVAEELKRSGLPVTGTLGGLRAPPPRSDFEAYSDPGTRPTYEDFRRFEESVRPMRGPAAGGGEAEREDLIRAYMAQGMSQADAVIAATKVRHGRGGAGKERAKYVVRRLERDVTFQTKLNAHDPEAVATWNAALAALDEEEGPAKGGPSLRNIGPTGPNAPTAPPAADEEPENPDDFIDRQLGGPGLGQEYLLR